MPPVILRRGNRSRFNKDRTGRLLNTGCDDWCSSSRVKSFSFTNQNGYSTQTSLGENVPPGFITYRLGNFVNGSGTSGSAIGSSNESLLGTNTCSKINESFDGNNTGVRPGAVILDFMNIKLQLRYDQRFTTAGGLGGGGSLNAGSGTIAGVNLVEHAAFPNGVGEVYWGPNYEVDIQTYGANPAPGQFEDGQITNWVKATPSKADGTYNYEIKWRNKIPRSQRGLPATFYSPTTAFPYNPQSWRLKLITNLMDSVFAASNGGFPPSMILRVPAFRVLVQGTGPGQARINTVNMSYQVTGRFTILGYKTPTPAPLYYRNLTVPAFEITEKDDE